MKYIFAFLCALVAAHIAKNPWVATFVILAFATFENIIQDVANNKK